MKMLNTWKRLQRFVEERLDKIGKTTKVNSQTKIAVLAALNITADLFKLNKLHKETVKKLETYETRSKELSDSVDRYLTQHQESRH